MRDRAHASVFERASASRRITRPVHLRGIQVGGGAPISVQSMTTTATSDVNSTLRQIDELANAGCQLIRVAVPTKADVDVLPTIVSRASIPVVADIHFQPRYVFSAIDAGCAGIRVNPGNIKKFDDRVAEIAEAASRAGVPIRIGVNAGSLDSRILQKYGKPTADALVESALWECSIFAEYGFHDIKVSVKHHDPVVTINAYEMLAERCNYAIHLGLWASGRPPEGIVKSAVAIGVLLERGIGDTIRVGLSAPPVEEVKAGIAILEALSLR
jgi:(E)-4-hydroxy-3-methylbut-2-enyl-diphosphate synthase